jgi:hypothetical protein
MRRVAAVVALLSTACVSLRPFSGAASSDPALSSAVSDAVVRQLTQEKTAAGFDTLWWAWSIRLEALETGAAKRLHEEIYRIDPPPTDSLHALVLRIVSIKSTRVRGATAWAEVTSGAGWKCRGEWWGNATFYEYRFRRRGAEWHLENVDEIGHSDSMPCPPFPPA